MRIGAQQRKYSESHHTMLQKAGGHRNSPSKTVQRHEFYKELAAWGDANTDKPQSLEQVTQQLHTSRVSLSQGCKESRGIGPMEVLRFIRLEHVHLALRQPNIRQRLKLNNAEETMMNEGFMSRGNFASAYKTYFGESPNQTLIRSRQLDSEQDL